MYRCVRKYESRFPSVHHRGQDWPELQEESSMRLAQTIFPSYTRSIDKFASCRDVVRSCATRSENGRKAKEWDGITARR